MSERKLRVCDVCGCTIDLSKTIYGIGVSLWGKLYPPRDGMIDHQREIDVCSWDCLHKYVVEKYKERTA